MHAVDHLMNKVGLSRTVPKSLSVPNTLTIFASDSGARKFDVNARKQEWLKEFKKDRNLWATSKLKYASPDIAGVYISARIKKMYQYMKNMFYYSGRENTNEITKKTQINHSRS